MPLTRCKHCDCWIQTEFGIDAPAAHADASGTKDDPRSPGDWDDICDACNCRDVSEQARSVLKKAEEQP